jgi:hypothetical protein
MINSGAFWAGGYFFRNVNETIFLLDWDNIGNARGFAQSDEARNVLLEGGLRDKPDVYFLEEVDKPGSGTKVFTLREY